MARFEVRIAPGVMAEIMKISRWWAKNRPFAPRLFDRELDVIIGLLESAPEIGRPSKRQGFRDTRLVVLRRSRYLVAYQIREADQQIWIVQVRHGSRRPHGHR